MADIYNSGFYETSAIQVPCQNPILTNAGQNQSKTESNEIDYEIKFSASVGSAGTKQNDYQEVDKIS